MLFFIFFALCLHAYAAPTWLIVVAWSFAVIKIPIFIALFVIQLLAASKS